MRLSENIKKEILIAWEELKAVKLPIFIKIFLISLATPIILLFIIFLMIDKTILTEGYWIPLVISIQTITIILQLFFITQQFKYQKIPYQPYFIIEPKYGESKTKKTSRKYFDMWIINEGEIANRVKYYYYLNGKLQNIGDLGTMHKDDKINLQRFTDINQFQFGKILIRIHFFDKVGNWSVKKWVKMKEDIDFTPI